MIDVSGGQQVVHCNLHQHEDIDALQYRLLQKLCESAPDHVFVHQCDRSKATALDQDCFLVEHLGRLKHFALRAEHHRVGQPIFNEL